MRKHKSIFKSVLCSPYVVELWIVITNNPETDCKKLNRKYKDLDLEWEDGSAAMTFDFYDDNYLLVMFDAKEPIDANTICHEVVHIKNRIYHHAGTSNDVDNDEPEAYLSGWLAEQIENAWLEWKKLK